MTKVDLMRQVARRTDLTNEEARDIIDIIFDQIREALLKGDTFRVDRFFSASIAERKGREGRNPATGEPIQIPAKRVLKIKASPTFKKELNGQSVD